MALGEFHMTIGGHHHEARQHDEVHNPATGEVIARVPRGDAAAATHAVEAAQKAFESPAWAEMDPSQRGRLLWKVGELVREQINSLPSSKLEDTLRPRCEYVDWA